MKIFTKLLAAPAVLVCLMLVVSSCSKENQSPTALEDQLLPNEFLEKQPKPGIYMITKFTDTGDDKTSLFAGYTFEFQADGDFIATTGTGTVFNGSWSMNAAETVMTINIAGNAAVSNLDDDTWNVIKITNLKIRIKKPGPDVVIFEKI